jgi:hypothetical protein
MDQYLEAKGIGCAIRLIAGQTIPPTPFYVGSAYLRRTGRWVNVNTQMTAARP